MSRLIKGPKDFWTGVIYLVFGLSAVWIARDYGMGTGSRMGPGYFPIVLGGLLTLFGVVAVIRAFIKPGEGLGDFAIKATLLIVVGTLLFGFLMVKAGLVVSLLTLTLLSAAASAKFKFEWRAVAGLVVLVAFCSLVFVKGLGVPMPILGSWFGN